VAVDSKGGEGGIRTEAGCILEGSRVRFGEFPSNLGVVDQDIA
jgi:hypothetical protein